MKVEQWSTSVSLYRADTGNIGSGEAYWRGASRYGEVKTRALVSDAATSEDDRRPDNCTFIGIFTLAISNGNVHVFCYPIPIARYASNILTLSRDVPDPAKSVAIHQLAAHTELGHSPLLRLV